MYSVAYAMKIKLELGELLGVPPSILNVYYPHDPHGSNLPLGVPANTILTHYLAGVDKLASIEKAGGTITVYDVWYALFNSCPSCPFCKTFECERCPYGKYFGECTGPGPSLWRSARTLVHTLYSDTEIDADLASAYNLLKNYMDKASSCQE